MLTLSDMPGMWRRSLIVMPDGTRDTTTWVGWLQGPTLFVDLRQPQGRPSFEGVRALGDLTGRQVAWLAEQEGFAGRLEQDGAFFVWQRLMDFQPPSPTADSGRLYVDGDMVVEEGRYSPYVEHWHRDEEGAQPFAGLRLLDRASGAEGFLVRVGSVFMFARAAINRSMPQGARLAACIGFAASLEEARSLVDCEISFGRVSASGWIIERSSLPYREGARLDPQISRSEQCCKTEDISGDGSAMLRRWDIIELEGDASALGESLWFASEAVAHD